jgi:hypothetical protein
MYVVGTYQVVEHLKSMLKDASETTKQSPLAFLHQ